MRRYLDDVRPAPLMPPPTDAELAWWRPRQRRLKISQFIVRALPVVPVCILRLMQGHAWAAVDPAVQVVSYACAGALYVFVSRQWVEDRVSREMITAIRDRRVRQALLTPPSE